MKPSSIFAFVVSAALSLILGSASSSADTIESDLSLNAQAFDHNGLKTHSIGSLNGSTSIPTTDSNRYEIARIGLNAYHWSNTGPVVVELFRQYYHGDGYLRFEVSAGYHLQHFSGSVTLLESRGAHLVADVALGEPVPIGTHSDGTQNHYVPVYVDVGYYSRWRVRLTHPMKVHSSDVPIRNSISVLESPIQTTLSNFQPSPTGADRLSMSRLYAGRIGIGTTNATHPLTVNGTIRAKEVIVESGWADYVFEDGYELMPLSALEAHIRKHRRLPGIPSAAVVEESGVSLAESQRLLLEKVEELTLHVIEQERQLNYLKERLAKSSDNRSK